MIVSDASLVVAFLIDEGERAGGHGAEVRAFGD